jgi:hypothetical protein
MINIITWVIRLASKYTNGSISVGKTVFVIKCTLAFKAFVLVANASENVIHGIRPHKNTTIKGILPAGLILNPTEKTNQ